jgi:hypothetical protein
MKYPTNIQCSWLITVTSNARIKLNFTEIILEGIIQETNTCFDWVKVYDGPTINSGLLGKSCESNLPGPVVSKGNQMLIKFFSGNTGVEKGFHAEYTTTDQPPSPTIEPLPTAATTSSSSQLNVIMAFTMSLLYIRDWS